MQKYCIVPDKENMFWQLVQGMELAEDERKLLKACSIKHVEVSPKSNRWEILLLSQELVGDELLGRAAAHIRQGCRLSEVLFYQHVVDVEAAVDKAWAKLVELTADGNPTVAYLLRRAEHVMDGSRLILNVPGELGGEILRAHSVPLMLRKSIKKMLGFSCDIECNALDEEAWQTPSEDAFDTPEYVSALRQESTQEPASSGEKPVSKPAVKPKKKVSKPQKTAEDGYAP
ncbi:MAG: PolC-type DNA polymerase III, partial [Selenomonadaceae bacterium]|nr:PolC-type DNA polymerase III [Selenomonadaceae bacterium]